MQQQPSTQLQQQQAPAQQQQQYKQALAEKDAQISVLQKKLEHYRSWLSSLQCQMQHKDPQVIKNARRLYIGGIPDATREVCLCWGSSHKQQQKASAKIFFYVIFV